jgi:hypothetical protein
MVGKRETQPVSNFKTRTLLIEDTMPKASNVVLKDTAPADVITLDNIADNLVRISLDVEKAAIGYTACLSFLFDRFGRDAVMEFNGNKCRECSTPEKTAANRKAYATELGLEVSDFEHLRSVWAAVKTRRPDCWNQAKNIMLSYEKSQQALDAPPTASNVEDKPEVQAQLEVEVAKVKVAVDTAKVAKQEAELAYKKAKLMDSNNPALPKMEADIKAASDKLTKIETQKAEAAKKLAAVKADTKRDNEYAELCKRIDVLKKWCKESSTLQAKEALLDAVTK